MKTNKLLSLTALGALFILSACSPTVKEAASPRPASSVGTSVVSATGEVVPARQATLSVSASGVIEAVLIVKGEFVRAGQVLVQLEGTEQQLALISAAELELVNATFALDALYDDTALMAAKALRSAEVAEEALEDLKNLELQQALALKAVAVAEKNLKDAENKMAFLTKTPTQASIDQAYGNLLLAEDQLNKTLEDIADIEWQFKKYSSIPRLPKDIKMEIVGPLKQALKGLEVRRTQAQLAYNNAQTRYNNLLEPPDPIDVGVAEAALAAAQSLLLQAERDLERVLDGPEAGDVAMLEAQIEKGHRDYEIYSAGPDPDDVSLAEARLSNAQAQLAAAKEILTDLELVAAFDGVVSELYINPNEWVSPGSPVLLLADLEHLQVETTDLGEIDVAKIKVGDTAVITFDALPDLVLEGTVVRIAPKADTSAGVNYPVVLELSETPDELRWGMTSFVDIEIE